MKPIIKVEELSKSYNISHQHKPEYSTLKDDLARILKKPFGGRSEDESEVFWALKDVSFEVNQGEIFGVIGKNGSGKSTMLKILSRIVEPTKGRIEMHGRVASLLEVGTGFHPELTGRENIYFNGSMIGMSRQEIRKRFNEIVEFSEIEKFLDTPVKFYSSGMYVRLAFSVAAHLEPDILILDEVLAVGDAAFQKKSLNKIISTMESGCTVLIVSHSMENIRTLCKRGLLLAGGKIKEIGEVDRVLMAYTGTMPSQSDPRSTLLKEVEVHYSRVKEPDSLSTTGPFEAEVEFSIHETLPNCVVNFFVEDSAGRYVFHRRADFSQHDMTSEKGRYKITFQLPRLSLNNGSFSTWFRFAAHKEYGEYALDTDREVFEVKGSDELLSTVDIDGHWQWTKLDKKAD